MELGEEVLKILNKTYEPFSLIETNFKRNDLPVKTSEAGKPILLFMRKKDENEKIKGGRFTCMLTYRNNGEVLKNRGDKKSKASY